MKTIAFVCTGNTCRSPMAEYMMKDLLSKHGIEGYNITSYGIYAFPEEGINALAEKELNRRGILDIKHSAKRITDKQKKECDLLITMTRAHLIQLNCPTNSSTINELTDCGEIADPYGGTEKDYENCANQISEALNVLIDKLAIIFDNNI